MRPLETLRLAIVDRGEALRVTVDDGESELRLEDVERLIERLTAMLAAARNIAADYANLDVKAAEIEARARALGWPRSE